MPVLLIGGGLVGSQIANILVNDGEDVTVLDYAPQPDCLAENVDIRPAQDRSRGHPEPSQHRQCLAGQWG